MANITVLDDGIDIDSATLVEGLPGVGLVGKIAADHLVESFDMTRYANVHCEELPPVVTYGNDDPDLRTPVRLYADEERNLLVLQSDVPVSPNAATEFATCISDWFTERDVTPLYLSGLPHEKDDDPPSMYGVAAGDGGRLLADAAIDDPPEHGLVSGPTGALLAHAVQHDTTAVGLVVESDPQFPDPEAARVVLSKGVEPLSGISVPTEDLMGHASEIQQAKEELARRMQDASEKSTQATPLRMYQ